MPCEALINPLAVAQTVTDQPSLTYNADEGFSVPVLDFIQIHSGGGTASRGSCAFLRTCNNAQGSHGPIRPSFTALRCKPGSGVPTSKTLRSRWVSYHPTPRSSYAIPIKLALHIHQEMSKHTHSGLQARKTLTCHPLWSGGLIV